MLPTAREVQDSNRMRREVLLPPQGCLRLTRSENILDSITAKCSLFSLFPFLQSTIALYALCAFMRAVREEEKGGGDKGEFAPCNTDWRER